MQKKQLGSWGEKIAQKKLEELGLKIIETNYHTRFGEIDIIAKDKDELVFVEVKTRSNNLFGEAIEAISPSKLNNIIKSAQYYLQNKQLKDPQYRIDLIAIEKKKDDNQWGLKIIKNIF